MDEIGGRMELRSLYYFVRIAELGSITRAAAHLQIAQPALTRHVQRLESELDAALFTRANRGVRLTEAGQKLFDSAQRIPRARLFSASRRRCARSSCPSCSRGCARNTRWSS